MKSVLVSAAWYEFTTSQAAHARLNSPTRIKVATRGRALKPARWQESLICSRVRLDGINLNGDANTLGSDRFVPFYHRTARPNPPVGRLVPFVAAGKLMGVHKAFAGGHIGWKPLPTGTTPDRPSRPRPSNLVHCCRNRPATGPGLLNVGRDRVTIRRRRLNASWLSRF